MPILLVLPLVLSQAAVPSAEGLGGYRFGMTREQVSAVADCPSYQPVSTTGGLECREYPFLGRKITISFLFGPEGLYRMQLWIYEGKERWQAESAVDDLNAYLVEHFGGVRYADPSRQDEEVTAAGLVSAALEAAHAALTRRAQIFWTALSPPPGRQLYGSAAVADVLGSDTLYVFLFLSVPPTE